VSQDKAPLPYPTLRRFIGAEVERCDQELMLGIAGPDENGKDKILGATKVYPALLPNPLVFLTLYFEDHESRMSPMGLN